MKSIKGPALFLAHFAGLGALCRRYSTVRLDNICRWAASLGYKGVQVPAADTCFIDIAKAANSTVYCEEILGLVASHGLAITELSTHLQGQLVAVNPVYDEVFDAFAPVDLRGRPSARQHWAVGWR
jgi:sugar phosphate isomerase/epimerase